MRTLIALMTVVFSTMSVSVTMADNSATKKTDEVVQEELWIAEPQPQFPGGDLALREWINQNKIYPQEAIKKGIEGRVIVKFTIEEDGTVTNGKIVRGVDSLLDNEALRLVSIMPKWTQVKFCGEYQQSTYILPVTFKLPPTEY